MRRRAIVAIVVFVSVASLLLPSPALPSQGSPDPHQLLEKAEQLAWNKAWTRAAPLYEEAERLFAARGDGRNVLYAQVNHLRARLPGLSISEVSEQLAGYLQDPIVRSDDRLRLRVLIVKGETDTDLDPFLAEQSWREALELATRLDEAGWANRARGELGLIAFLQGDVTGSIMRLGQALETAVSTGDVPSQVRWLTLFGHGYVQFGRVEQALSLYDRALEAGRQVPDLQFPVMTYVGKGEALARLGRFAEAEQVFQEGLAAAGEHGALGFQAELTFRLGLIAHQRQETTQALALLDEAVNLARQAGGNRILVGIALKLAGIQRTAGLAQEAEKTLREGIDIARALRERVFLPRLLAQLAEVRLSQQQHGQAADLLEEASDLLEGLIANVTSPWLRSRLIQVMDEVFVARIRLEGSHVRDPGRLSAVVEQARGRALLDLLVSTPGGEPTMPAALRAGEKELSALQVKLFDARDRAERQRLLDDIFIAEERLAPMSLELFNRTRTEPRRPLPLRDVQRALRDDELFLQFALAEPESYALVVTNGRARIQSLAGKASIETQTQNLLQRIHRGMDSDAEGRRAWTLLLDRIPELSTRRRLVISPDGDLHQLPFEILMDAGARRVLDTHVVSYVPSGSVLAILRQRDPERRPARLALAVSASPAIGEPVSATSSTRSVLGAVERGIYDVDAMDLPPLPSASDEARSVAAILGSSGTTLLLGESATEFEVKRQPLHEYQVLHFAVHGIVSTPFPNRSALVFRPGGGEDGLFQGREILMLRLNADLVTLSACETGSGSVHGQEGVSSLVRPFLAAGARTVVANAWTADDTFSLGLMRELYRQLAGGADVGDALRAAKLRMLEQFGPYAVPKLWSGVLLYGDGAATIMPAQVSAP